MRIVFCSVDIVVVVVVVFPAPILSAMMHARRLAPFARLHFKEGYRLFLSVGRLGSESRFANNILNDESIREFVWAHNPSPQTSILHK